jgi:putative thioredoxin
LAQAQQVRSVPLVRIFRHGRQVEEIQGYIPAQEVHRHLARHIPRPVDARLGQALRVYQSGNAGEGLSLLAQAALDDPGNTQIPLTLGRLLMAERQFAKARAVFTGLPEAVRGEPEVENLIAHLEFILTAEQARPADELNRRVEEDAEDLDACFELAALDLVGDRPEAALRRLLEILKVDAGYRDSAARKGINAIFALLAGQDELIEKYRAELYNILH